MIKRESEALAYTNRKTKHYSDGTTNSIICRESIFKDPFNITEAQQQNELARYEERVQKTNDLLEYLEAHQNMSAEDWHEWRKAEDKRQSEADKLLEKVTGEKVVRDDSVKRAKDSIFDYVLNNDFEYFFTGTINPEKLDSREPKILLKPVQEWLKKMTARYDMQYILIAELHKSGNIHFHGLFKASDKLKLVDSGTKLYKGYNKPVSDDRAYKLGLSDGRIVYNLANWRFGFSTAVRLVGERINTAFYITKYITKDCKKIFGKFFWHNRALKKPQITYDTVDFDSIDSIERNSFKYVFVSGDEIEKNRSCDDIQLFY